MIPTLFPCSEPFALEIGEFSVKIRRKLVGEHRPFPMYGEADVDLTSNVLAGCDEDEGQCAAVGPRASDVSCAFSSALPTSSCVADYFDDRVSPAEVCWIEVQVAALDGTLIATFKPHWSMLQPHQR